MESASDTDIDPLNEPPFGVIVGVLTVLLFTEIAVVVAEPLERAVPLDVLLVLDVIEI